VDSGDAVAAHHIRVDDDPSFASPEIDDPLVAAPYGAVDPSWTVSRPIGELAGVSNLVKLVTYYWRIQAEDMRHGLSDWSPGVHYFAFGIPPPVVTGWRRRPDGTMAIEWSGAMDGVKVYFSPSMMETNWQRLDGPALGTNWLLSLPTNHVGFYRVVAE
jgi:hypothetical protein